MTKRTNALADRLEHGARALANLASALTEAEWQTRLLSDGRKIGVVVHHVATVYPLELQLAQTLAAGKPVTGVTMKDVSQMNTRHAVEHHAITKEAALNCSSTAGGSHIRQTLTRISRSESLNPGCSAHVPIHPRGSRSRHSYASSRRIRRR